MITLVLCLAVYLVCLVLLRKFVSSPDLVARLADQATHRSLHVGVKPRVGGLAIFCSLGIGTALLMVKGIRMDSAMAFTTLAYTALFAISIIDDVKSLHASTRLIFHLSIVSIWVWVNNQSLRIGPVTESSLVNYLLPFVIVIGVTWAANLYNFMDGADGLAGSMTVIGFVSYAIAAHMAGDFELALFALVIASTNLAFLWFNWPPSTLFLGDSGSIPLGFLAAAIGLIGIHKGNWGPEFPFAVFAMFWIDATQTLFRRALSGERIWKPHKSHWYQKTIRGGVSHLTLVKTHCSCSVVISAIALISFVGDAQRLVHNTTLALSIVCLVVLAFGAWAEIMFSKSNSQK
jgi:UDP-GlcNAc:undecaprenyl-phosphate/decaprenyl-phosphate GlcNAc-1-phosphate transferase